LISACLLELPCRYDGKTISRPKLSRKLDQHIIVPVCPEQLGGLPTPRPAAEIIGGDGIDVIEGRARVVTKVKKIDVTPAFISGAKAVLKIAKIIEPNLCILKAKSPSCGLTPIIGVTGALLLANGYDLLEIA